MTTNQLAKRQIATLFLIASLSATLFAQSKPQNPNHKSAGYVLRQYVEARLDWTDWKYYSQFITWPDEPGWDCWWVAKDYRIGKSVSRANKTVIPVTYKRLGLFCSNFDWKPKSESATVNYEIVRKQGVWKIDGPIPDYPYTSLRSLQKYASRTISSPETSAKERQEAHRISDLVTAAANSP